MFFEELVYIMTRPQQEEKSTDEDWLIRYMQTCELWIRFSVVNYTEKKQWSGNNNNNTYFYPAIGRNFRGDGCTGHVVTV